MDKIKSFSLSLHTCIAIIVAVTSLALFAILNAAALRTFWPYALTAALSVLGLIVAMTCALLDFLAWDRKRTEARERALKAIADAAEQKKMAEAAQRKQQAEERKQQVEEWGKHHATTYFKVAGVTFQNEDGSSRQRHLRSLMDEIEIDDAPEVELVPYKFKGEDAIRVVANHVCIGNVPAKKVDEVQALLPRIESLQLDVEAFYTADDNRKIYRADVYVTYAKK